MTNQNPEHFTAVLLDKAYRLLNHGPTVLVSSAHNGIKNVMAAAWSMPLDFDPPKVSVVIDKATLTRELVEGGGVFALNIPSRALAAQTLAVGTDSAKSIPDKLVKHNVNTFSAGQIAAPLVHGCVGWLECRVIPEPHNQKTYDLFIGEVVAAWADSRVFSNGHWHFHESPTKLRTLHYVAGGDHLAAHSAHATVARADIRTHQNSRQWQLCDSSVLSQLRYTPFCQVIGPSTD